MVKIVGKEIKPSYAIGLQYQHQLIKLTKMMIKDVNDFIAKHYKKNSEQIESIAQDENPVVLLQSLLKKRLKGWSKIFQDKGIQYATKMVNNVDKHNKNMLKYSLGELADMITLKLDKESRQILYAKKASIQENVNLITNIQEEYANRINTAVMQSISRGRDNTYLEEQLESIAGITGRRAKNISRDQLNKASSVINNARQLDIGINKNIWHHSHAGKTPRVSHQNADGKEYNITKGCKIDGEYIYPGQLVNCRCFSSPVLEL